MLCTSYVFSEHFYTSSYGLTGVLKSTSMLIYGPLNILPNIFPCGISVQWPPGLRTDPASSLRTRLTHWFTHRSGLTDRSKPIRFSACAADPANVELVSQQCIKVDSHRTILDRIVVHVEHNI